jgi:hypothetical protein
MVVCSSSVAQVASWRVYQSPPRIISHSTSGTKYLIDCLELNLSWKRELGSVLVNSPTGSSRTTLTCWRHFAAFLGSSRMHQTILRAFAVLPSRITPLSVVLRALPYKKFLMVLCGHAGAVHLLPLPYKKFLMVLCGHAGAVHLLPLPLRPLPISHYAASSFQARLGLAGDFLVQTQGALGCVVFRCQSR